MDTQQVERELTALLHQRADRAMSLANTQQAHRTFQSEVAAQPRTGRRHWVLGAAAAAVVALVVGAALWPSDQVAERGVPAVEGPAATYAANLAAAEGAAAAFAAHDTDMLRPHLEPGQSPLLSFWDTELKQDASWNVEYLLEPCTQSYETYVGTFVFECPYSMHLLGSREVGEGPFPDNRIVVVVKDGKIRSAETMTSSESNGIARYVDAVLMWLEENPPQDSRCAPRSPKACAEFMLKHDENVTSAERPTWDALWQTAIAEYVAATNETG